MPCCTQATQRNLWEPCGSLPQVLQDQDNKMPCGVTVGNNLKKDSLIYNGLTLQPTLKYLSYVGACGSLYVYGLHHTFRKVDLLGFEVSRSGHGEVASQIDEVPGG